MKTSFLARWLAACATGDAVALVTHVATGEQRLILKTGAEGSLTLSDDAETAVLAAIDREQSQLIEVSDGQVFVEIWQKPLHLIVIGAVHIAQYLVPMARLVGFKTTIVDPRTSFASQERFPDTELVTDWPDMALDRLGLDRRSALVALTHDPKLDDPALQTALKSAAFYIGALGSRRSHAKRVGRLTAAGESPDEISRIRGPVGLALGAVSPSEIAVSIIAEIIAAHRRVPLGERTEAASVTPHPIAALILAAGQSRRMGRNKLLIEVGGLTLVERAVDAALNAGAAEVLVVIGHEADRLRDHLAGKPVRLIENPDYAAGLSTSIKAGVSALSAQTDGVVICLGDMPDVSASLLDRMFAAFAPEQGREIVLPLRAGRRGNPVLWARKHFPALCALDGDQGAKHLIGEHRTSIAAIEVEDDSVFTDVDTPTALEAYIASRQ